ncbi:hypothetical protein NPIL_319681, partial [Nephila pilipes]
ASYERQMSWALKESAEMAANKNAKSYPQKSCDEVTIKFLIKGASIIKILNDLPVEAMLQTICRRLATTCPCKTFDELIAQAVCRRFKK